MQGSIELTEQIERKCLKSTGEKISRQYLRYQKAVEYRYCTLYNVHWAPLLPISRKIFEGKWKNKKKGTFVATTYLSSPIKVVVTGI
jgi:hypothetical protein